MLPSVHHANTEQTASDSPDLTFYASLELSRATWLVTCLLPERDRMSKYSTPGGDGGALLGLLERLRARAQQLTGRPVKIVVIQEAGLDGFWVHRLLEANGIESHVVDPASIAVPRRRRSCSAPLPRILRRDDPQQEHPHGLLPGRVQLFCLAGAARHRRARRHRADPRRRLCRDAPGLGLQADRKAASRRDPHAVRLAGGRAGPRHQPGPCGSRAQACRQAR